MASDLKGLDISKYKALNWVKLKEEEEIVGMVLKKNIKEVVNILVQGFIKPVVFISFIIILVDYPLEYKARPGTLLRKPRKPPEI